MNTLIARMTASGGWQLLPLRLVIGYGFAAHGYAKLARGPESFAAILAAIGVPLPELMAWLTSSLELLGGVSLILGAAVTLLSVPLIIVLLTALFSVHLRYGFLSIRLKAFGASGAEFGPVGYELNLLYIVGLVVLALSAATPLSVDRWFSVRKKPPWRLAEAFPAHIRLARVDEVPRLREIEDEAGTLFSGLGLIDEARDVSFPLDELVRLVGIGQVWVACSENDFPVGMVIASVRDGAAYVEEMDVLPAYTRRGIGSRLLARVCEWARARGHTAVALSTFREVPWNGPFYRRQGFRELAAAELTPSMRRIRELEAQHGLRVEARVFMRRELGQ